MANEQFKALMDFYREFVKPDLDDIRANMATKDEINGHFDDVYKRFDQLETDISRSAPLSGASKSA